MLVLSLTRCLEEDEAYDGSIQYLHTKQAALGKRETSASNKYTTGSRADALALCALFIEARPVFCARRVSSGAPSSRALQTSNPPILRAAT